MPKQKVYPAKEQGTEPDETKEEKELDMGIGEKEADVYTEEGRELLKDNDEVEDWEEGFMEGASGSGQKAKCMKCGKDIEMNTCIEKEIEGELKWFCTAKCLTSFEKGKK